MRLRGAPMLGRDHLLAALDEAVAEGRSGHPVVVLVEGEAGMGKTRLVTEFLARLPEPRADDAPCLLRGSCASADRSDVPWGPFLDVLRDLRHSLGTPGFLDLAGRRAAELATLDPGIPVEPPSAGSDPGRLLRVLGGLLLDAAASRETVLVIEDVQWADENSQRLLEYVVRSLRQHLLTVILTVRTDGVTPDSRLAVVDELLRAAQVSRLELTPLDRDQVGRQLAHLRGRTPEPGELDRVLELSAGVPLYVEEVAAALDSGTDLSQMPGRLHAHRLTALEPHALDLVEAAAVAMKPPRRVALLAASGLTGDDFEAALAAAVEGGVLRRRAATIEFRHDVLRAATRERMAPERERELHAVWAEVLEPESDELEAAVSMAHHRLVAAEPGAALVACLRAADVAGRASACAVQLEMLHEAMRLWPEIEEPDQLAGCDLVEVLGHAAEAAYLVSDAAESERLARRAVALLAPDSPPERGAWLDLLAIRSRDRDEDTIAPDELLEVVERIPSRPATRERVIACLTATDALVLAGRPRDAEVHVEEAARSAQVLGLAELEASAASSRAQLCLHEGRYDDALRSAIEACRLADASGDAVATAHARQSLALLQWHVGELVGATENCAIAVEALGGDRPGPSPTEWAMNLANVAEGRIDQGEWAEAQEALDRVLAVAEPRSRAARFAGRLSSHLRLWREGPDPGYLVGAEPMHAVGDVGTLALQDLLGGRFTAADISSAHRDLVRARLELRPVLADERTVQLPEDLYRVLEVAARTEADVRTEGWPDPEPSNGAWTVGRVELLLDLMEPVGPIPLAQDARIRADLGRWAGLDDPATWRHVVQMWRRVPCPRPLALALERLGSAAASVGDRSTAQDALAEALRISERLGARPLSASVHAVARRHGLRFDTAVGPGRGPADLTARELEVLRLVADGSSNAEIGEQLFISPKTVSVHVSHILDKFGVGTRTAATTVAHQAGLLETAALEPTR